MVKEDLETVIDRLLDYVRTNKLCTLNQAAKALALGPYQVEKLALLLEESELMEVQYTLLGVKLAPRFPEKEEEKKKAEVKAKASLILQQTQALEKEVSTSEHLLEFMERDITRRLETARGLIQQLDRKKDYSQAELAFVKKETEGLSKQMIAFSARLAELKAHEESFGKDVEKFEARLSRVKTNEKRVLSLLESLLSKLPKLGGSAPANALPNNKKVKHAGAVFWTRARKRKIALPKLDGGKAVKKFFAGFGNKGGKRK
jgi:chromosome segregation ATPase